MASSILTTSNFGETFLNIRPPENKNSRPYQGREKFPRYHPASGQMTGARSETLFISALWITAGDDGSPTGRTLSAFSSLLRKDFLSVVLTRLTPYPDSLKVLSRHARFHLSIWFFDY